MTDVWTALPGIVQSYDAITNTCVVQPAIKGLVRAADGATSWVQLPLFQDVVVHFPGGGGLALTFPLAQGDEVLVIFSSRCIDAWWQSGGIQQQAELRMHDLSDGFAIPMVWSVPNVLPNISTTTTQLRNQAGTAYIELTPAGVINIVAPGGLNVNGEIIATGEVIAKSSHTVSAHVHGGVTTGAGSTGGPTG